MKKPKQVKSLKSMNSDMDFINGRMFCRSSTDTNTWCYGFRINMNEGKLFVLDHENTSITWEHTYERFIIRSYIKNSTRVLTELFMYENTMFEVEDDC